MLGRVLVKEPVSVPSNIAWYLGLGGCGVSSRFTAALVIWCGWLGVIRCLPFNSCYALHKPSAAIARAALLAMHKKRRPDSFGEPYTERSIRRTDEIPQQGLYKPPVRLKW